MNELERKIRKYKLDELLLLLARLSRNIYKKRAFYHEVERKSYLGGFSQKKRQILPAFALADLSYIAINNSNDYRSVKPTEDDVFKLSDILAGITDNEAKRKIVEINPEDIRVHILFGLAQKQFWYQDITRSHKIFYGFLRYYVLLYEIPKFFPEIKSPNDDLIEITGFDIKSFSQLLLAGWSYNMDTSPVIGEKVAEDLTRRIPIITKLNVKKCLDFFTADYKYYRKPNFQNNPLFFKPIVRTDTNKLIIQDSFIWARKFHEGIYWIIRDKYMKENSRAFTSNFGKYYERYVEELLGYYLTYNRYEKVHKVENDKRADWLVYTKEYILVIEQKSCLMTIALKKEYPSILLLDEYLENFKEAYLQIAGSVRALGKVEKKIIKLVLHFETFYVGEAVIKEKVNRLCKDEIDDLTNYYFIDTDEFEKLIQVLSDDEESFNKIIETKIDYENNAPISAGREFHFIISKHAKLKTIRYLESYKQFVEGLFENL